MLKAGGKKEDGGKQDDSFSTSCVRKMPCTCSLKGNSKGTYVKLFNEEVKDKTLPLQSKSDKIKDENKTFKEKTRIYIHTNRYSSFFCGKNNRGSAKNCLMHDQYLYMLQHVCIAKVVLSNLAKQVLC